MAVDCRLLSAPLLVVINAAVIVDAKFASDCVAIKRSQGFPDFQAEPARFASTLAAAGEKLRRI